MPALRSARSVARPEFAAGGRSARTLSPGRPPKPAPPQNRAESIARLRRSLSPAQSAPALATRRAAGQGGARGRDPLRLGLLQFRLDPSRTPAGEHRAAPLGWPPHPPGGLVHGSVAA